MVREGSRGGPWAGAQGWQRGGTLKGDIWGDLVTLTTELEARIGPKAIGVPGAL